MPSLEHEVSGGKHSHLDKHYRSPIEVDSSLGVAHGWRDREATTTQHHSTCRRQTTRYSQRHDESQEQEPMENKFIDKPALPRYQCRASKGCPRSRFNVMQPIEIMYVKIRAALATDSTALGATSDLAMKSALCLY